MYGHLDKQRPGRLGKGLGPWTPVLRDGKLYGRGGPTTVTRFRNHRRHPRRTAAGLPHARIVVLIE